MGGQGRRLAALLLGCLLLSSCGEEGPPADAQQPTASPSEGSTTGASAPLGENAVEPPGPLEDRLYRSDMLIFGKDVLSDDVVERVTKLPQVAQVERIGLGQVLFENRAYTIAAVDPATFRRFTPYETAEKQTVWNRVAGGEVAVPQEIADRLADKQDFVTLGSGNDAPSVHIGAYAPLTTGIDMVVNQAWVDDLDSMVFGNALLLTTEDNDPSTIRKPVQQIVGKGVSVQDLDIASQLGLDPDATQTAFLTGGSLASVVGTFNYTVLGGGRIAPDPSWVSANIVSEPVPILGTVTCHRALMPQLRAALEEVVSRGLADKIHPEEYAGCYYPRFIAGSTTLSNHSFGLALDLNVPGNLRGTVGEMDRDVVAIFKKWGFGWGGDWGYTDPMHFELAQVVDPR